MKITDIIKVIELGLKPDATFYSSREKAEIISDLFEKSLENFQSWLNDKHYTTKGYNDKDFSIMYNNDINNEFDRRYFNKCNCGDWLPDDDPYDGRCYDCN